MSKTKQELDELYQFEYNRRFPEYEDPKSLKFAKKIKKLTGDTDYSELAKQIADSKKPESILAGGILGAAEGYADQQLDKADQARSPQMDDITRLTGDILLQTQKLKDDLQKDQTQTKEAQSLLFSLSPAIRQYAEAKYQGDVPAETEIGRGIFQKLVQAGAATGEFVSMRDGNLIMRDENGLDEIHINDLIARSGVDPHKLFGDDAERIMSQLSIGAKQKYEQNQALSNAKLDELYGKVQSYGVNNALKQQELNNFISPEDKAKQELDHNVMRDRAKDNQNFIRSELAPEITGKRKLLNAIQRVGDITSKDPNLTGSGLQHKVRRELQKTLGLNPNIDLLKLNDLEFEKTLKPILGAQLSEQEGLRVLLKNLSAQNHPQAIKQYVAENTTKLQSEIDQGVELIKRYEQNPYDNLYGDYITTNEIPVANTNTSPTQDSKIKMRTKAGQVKWIPTEKVKEAESLGAVPIQ